MTSLNSAYDAVIIGSGPNGLAAAIRLALEGLKVKIFEAADTVGGGARSHELIESGFMHDVCSAIHPMAISSPFFRSLPLHKYGLEWIHPDFPIAHPLDNRPAVIMHKSIRDMDIELESDFHSWASLFEPFSNNWEKLSCDLLSPFGMPSHPLLTTKFGLNAIKSAETLVHQLFKEQPSKALFGGIAAHSLLDLRSPLSAAAGILLGTAAHAAGWPLVKGGSGELSRSLAEFFISLGGTIETGCKIGDYRELPSSKTTLYDLSPSQILQISGDLIPERYKKTLHKFRHGPGVFKIDYILNEPVPWSDPRCSGAGTVHLGGSFEEMVLSEKQVQSTVHPEKPFVLSAQQSLFDSSRTSDHRHTFWAYCHVPNGSTVDMNDAIDNQIERFAPGFRDVVYARYSMNSADFQTYNSNYIGGDIGGGIQDVRQLFMRPGSLFNPYYLHIRGHYICSASSPPGGGVHGMCGYHASEAILNREFQISKKDYKFSLDDSSV